MEMPYSKVISFLLVSMLLNQCAPCVNGAFIGGEFLSGAEKAAWHSEELLNGAKNELTRGDVPKFPSPIARTQPYRKPQPTPSEVLQEFIKRGVRKCLVKNVKAQLKLALCGEQLTQEQKAACCSTLDGTTPVYSTVPCPCYVRDGSRFPWLATACESPYLANNSERCP